MPKYTGPTVDTFIKSFGKLDLLAWMNKYWINQGDTVSPPLALSSVLFSIGNLSLEPKLTLPQNQAFWAHEFSKHATCFSTFDIPCYGPNYVKNQEVIEFYETAIKYFQRLPTWSWLKQAGITPSNSTTYSISEIQTALIKGYGKLPYTACSGPAYNTTVAGNGTTDNGKIYFSEAWYYFYVSWIPIRD